MVADKKICTSVVVTVTTADDGLWVLSSKNNASVIKSTPFSSELGGTKKYKIKRKGEKDS